MPATSISVSVTTRVPKYCRQKCKGRPDRAYVRVNGRTVMLGKYGSSESRRLYSEVISGRGTNVSSPGGEPTVAMVMASYLEHAKNYYPKTPERKVTEFDAIRCALRHVRKVSGGLSASDFGPKRLKEVRQSFIDSGQCRRTVNQNVGRVVRMFKWAAAEEMISASVPHALMMVSGLRRGRTEARESGYVQPVADAAVDSTVRFLPETIVDMVRLQRYTGMRPAEVCMLRPCDVDRTGDIWIYHPEKHKTQHHGKDRPVLIGIRGQDILLKYLARDSRAYCFCPCDSETKRRLAQHASRITPLSSGNFPGSNRAKNPKRRAGNKYEPNAYRRAVHRACDKAFPHPELGSKVRTDMTPAQVRELKQWQSEHRWSPNQLRHAAATEIRKQFGLEAAQIILGHSQADVTQVYAERDLAKGLEVARMIG